MWVKAAEDRAWNMIEIDELGNDAQNLRREVLEAGHHESWRRCRRRRRRRQRRQRRQPRSAVPLKVPARTG